MVVLCAAKILSLQTFAFCVASKVFVAFLVSFFANVCVARVNSSIHVSLKCRMSHRQIEILSNRVERGTIVWISYNMIASLPIQKYQVPLLSTKEYKASPLRLLLIFTSLSTLEREQF